MNKEQIVNHFSNQLERLHPKLMTKYDSGDLNKGHTIFVLSESYLKLGICNHYLGEIDKATLNFSQALKIFKELISICNAKPTEIKIGLISHVITWPYELAYLSKDMDSIKWLQSNWPRQAEDECAWYRAYQELLVDLFLGKTDIAKKRIESLEKEAFPDVKAETELLCALALKNEKAVCEKWPMYKQSNNSYIQNEWSDGLPSVLSIDGAALFELSKNYIDATQWPSEENYRFNKSKHTDSVNAAGV